MNPTSEVIFEKEVNEAYKTKLTMARACQGNSTVSCKSKRYQSESPLKNQIKYPFRVCVSVEI